LENQLKSISQKLNVNRAKFGAITLKLDSIDEAINQQQTEKETKQIEDYLEKKIELRENIEHYEKALDDLKTNRKQTPKHITISELPEDEKFSSLTNDKKQIMDTLKMIAYRAETAMAKVLEPEISKRKYTRVFLRQIFNTETDINPDYTNNTLNVKLHSLSNRRSNEIAKDLCAKLNETETIFPGTNMRIFYDLVAM